ncbi:hypothetical protein ANANG_G00302000 [Anguilla anguilla]|uniref:Uncharacterized protein n=1 Tax=Anguilla anguilla TaxID=7936 RepID=A0A9D3RI98_ANGAN|nr:hypothetical protein ANANG_G00302000 [Anguilla anguilla]
MWFITHCVCDEPQVIFQWSIYLSVLHSIRFISTVVFHLGKISPFLSTPLYTIPMNVYTSENQKYSCGLAVIHKGLRHCIRPQHKKLSNILWCVCVYHFNTKTYNLIATIP